jgi:MFS family permease
MLQRTSARPVGGEGVVGEQGMRRLAIGAVLAAGLLGEFAYALLLFPLLQRYLVFERGLGAGFPGYVLAAYGIARLVTQMPLGGAADQIGRRIAVALGYAAVTLGGLLCWAPAAPAILGGAALFGAGHALADPLLPAALAEGVPVQGRGRVIALLNLGQVAGLVAGLAGGAFLTDFAPTAAGFLTVAAANGVALALLALGALPLLRPVRPGRGGRSGFAWHALTDERAIDLFVALFLIALAMNLVMPNISLYSVRRLHRELHQLVPYLAPAAVFGVAALPFGGWLSDRSGRLPPLLLGSVLGTIGFAQLALAHGPVQVAIGAAVGAAGLALTLPASNVALLDVAGPEHRALLLSGMMAVQGLGQAAGPLFGGLLTQLIGPALPFAAGAIALWLVMPFTVLFASTPHDGAPGELVTYTPLTRFISRRHLARHTQHAESGPATADAEGAAASSGHPAEGDPSRPRT